VVTTPPPGENLERRAGEIAYIENIKEIIYLVLTYESRTWKKIRKSKQVNSK
jgi:hypothetical protein